MLPELTLKVRVTGRHPWFFRKMIRRPDRPIAAGSAVLVRDREGQRVGTGFYNPRTELALRLLDHRAIEDPDARLSELLDRAIDLREGLLDLPSETTAYRLVHGEGDGFPGLVLDRLGDTIVAQLFSLCMQQRLEGIGERLLERQPGVRLVLTVDDTARKREGMDAVPPPAALETEIVESGLRYVVHPGSGHKTGFFADQRENRATIRYLARGRRVLDLFCNSGGFSLNCARGGARQVVAVDLDEAAVAQARANAARNSISFEVRHDDAFDVLRGVRPGAFDLLILDPPKWAAGKHEVEPALHRYRDLNRLAFAALPAGALLLTCSCSGAVSEERFLATLRIAAAEAGRSVRMLAIRGAAPDHPIALECPETRYLCAVLAEVV